MRLFARKPKPPTIERAELARLDTIEVMARQMVKLLEDGKVDYDLLRRLKAVLNSPGVETKPE